MTYEQKPESAEFRTRKAQALDSAGWIMRNCSSYYDVLLHVTKELSEAEARGAAEQRRKDAKGVYGGWLPIETAPKDGTTILVPVNHIGADVVLWYLNGWRETSNMLLMRDPPTHWMPLPPFPSGDRPANVAALEARVKELEERLQYLTGMGSDDSSSGPRIIDLCFTAFMRRAAGKNEDGGSCDWFNDTRPHIAKQIERIRAAAIREGEQS